MQRFIRALGCCAVASSLAACVVTPQQSTQSRPAPNPHELAAHRLDQVDGRIANMNRSIDARVNQGIYAPPQGGALHRRLDTIRQEAHDMATQHGGGLSGDEQHVLNQELDSTAHAINQ
jgi:hypothetical protein